MKQSLFLCLLTILFSCTAQTDITPAIKSDAPDLDFSKPIWVNEFQYDGVFTIEEFYKDTFRAYYSFNGAEAKTFSPVNDRAIIENGFWFSPKISKFMGGLSYYSGINGKLSLNDVEIIPSYTGGGSLPSPLVGNNGIYIGKLSENTSLKYNADKGFTWKVLSVNIPNDDSWKRLNNLTPDDKTSFVHEKDGIKVFPEVVKIEKQYVFNSSDKELTIKFEAIKNADVIYFQFDRNGYYDIGPDDLGIFESKGFLKYVKGDANSITIKRSEASLFLWNKPEFTMTVLAVKYYTSTNSKRKFLCRNIATSQANITIK